MFTYVFIRFIDWIFVLFLFFLTIMIPVSSLFMNFGMLIFLIDDSTYYVYFVLTVLIYSYYHLIENFV